jgi:hypothetical protein
MALVSIGTFLLSKEYFVIEHDFYVGLALAAVLTGGQPGDTIKPVLGIRNRIRMFLGLPDPDPLVKGTDPDPSFFS